VISDRNAPLLSVLLYWPYRTYDDTAHSWNVGGSFPFFRFFGDAADWSKVRLSAVGWLACTVLICASECIASQSLLIELPTSLGGAVRCGGAQSKGGTGIGPADFVGLGGIVNASDAFDEALFAFDGDDDDDDDEAGGGGGGGGDKEL
jgi:hypothetical protein